MEAELRALRHELSNRNSSNYHAEAQVLSPSAQNVADEEGMVGDNNSSDRKRYTGLHINPNSNLDVNYEEDDTSLDERKLSIDLDKKSPNSMCQEEEEESEENEAQEGNRSSIPKHQDAMRHIQYKTSSNSHLSSDHRNSEEHPHKQRNGKLRLSDAVTSDDDEVDRHKGSEASSTAYSRENDSEDNGSRSPIPPNKPTEGEVSQIDMKEDNAKVATNSKSSNSTSHRKESNESKGRNSDVGIPRETGRKITDDVKTLMKNVKQSSSSSKGLPSSIKGSSSHVLHSGTSSSSNRS